MFVDENTIWPRPEPERRGEAAAPRRAANRFLILALIVALMPFSPMTLALLFRYIASWF